MRNHTITPIIGADLEARAARLGSVSQPVPGLDRETGQMRVNRLENELANRGEACMSAAQPICGTTGTIQADANSYWLHTPKFGPFDHFQRWRFAT
jgi:hypothetical protein